MEFLSRLVNRTCSQHLFGVFHSWWALFLGSPPPKMKKRSRKKWLPVAYNSYLIPKLDAPSLSEHYVWGKSFMMHITSGVNKECTVLKRNSYIRIAF